MNFHFGAEILYIPSEEFEHWWPYWLLLQIDSLPARLSYRPIFEHFVTSGHRFQSNSGAPKNQHHL